jgi:hypothetical protein
MVQTDPLAGLIYSQREALNRIGIMPVFSGDNVLAVAWHTYASESAFGDGSDRPGICLDRSDSLPSLVCRRHDYQSAVRGWAYVNRIGETVSNLHLQPRLRIDPR